MVSLYGAGRLLSILIGRHFEVSSLALFNLLLR